MFHTALVTLSAAVFAAASISAASLPVPRNANICYSGETAALTCYEDPNGTPQNVAVADVTFVAGYLRSYGRQTKAGRLFTMTAADAADCAEWTLYSHGSAMATAKHIDSSLNSSVLFEDIATTIDGGVGANATQKAGAIIGCLASGGTLGVQVNATNAAYTASAYTGAGYVTGGIMIKIVSSGA